jgi:hypothetical protein
MIRTSISHLAFFFVCLVFSAGLSSCKEKGPAEKAADAVDEAIK